MRGNQSEKKVCKAVNLKKEGAVIEGQVHKVDKGPISQSPLERQFNEGPVL